MRNGVEIPSLETGDDDMGGLKSPSPRVPIRTDADVSPLQLTKKDKSKQRQEKLQEEKDAASNDGPSEAQAATEPVQSDNVQVYSSNFIYNLDTKAISNIVY